MVIAIFSMSPTHAQLELDEQQQQQQRTADASSLFLRKRANRAARTGYVPPAAVQEPPTAAQVPTDHLSTDPAAFQPPTQPGEDAGLFDMSTP